MSIQAPPRRLVVDGDPMANLVVSSTLNTGVIPGLPKAIHALATDDHATLVTGLSPSGLRRRRCGSGPDARVRTSAQG